MSVETIFFVLSILSVVTIFVIFFVNYGRNIMNWWHFHVRNRTWYVDMRGTSHLREAPEQYSEEDWESSMEDFLGE